MRGPRPVTAPPCDRRSACIALAVTALWHAALVGWLSSLALRAREADGAPDPTDRIDIVFVSRRADAAPTAVRRPATDPAPTRGPKLTPGSATSAAQAGRAPVPEAVDPMASAIDHAESRSVVGDNQSTASPAPVPAPPPTIAPRPFAQPRNPLARDELDAPTRLRVRMRPPPSVELWLTKLAPVGYEADPCPEIARAITGLASDATLASRALLDDAVHYEAKYCR